jgi:hypothetical protein
MGVIGVWPGSDAERDALLLALSRHCIPLVGAKGEACWTRSSLEAACPVHSLLRDQQVLHSLVFMRRQRDRLCLSEFSEEV